MHTVLDPAAPAPTLPAAPLRGSRTWTLWAADGAVDVEVEADDTATVADVLTALADVLGGAAPSLWAGSSPLPEGTPLSAPALRHGAVLGLDRPGPRTGTGDGDPETAGALELQVVGGPDAGHVLPLGRGDLVVGRGAGCGFPLTDPDVSRRHVLVSVGAGQVTVTDLASSNGTVLRTPAGHVPLGDRPSPWAVGSTLLLGASAVRLSGPRGEPLDRSPAPQGRLRVRPVHARPVPAAEVSVSVPAPPPETARRRLGWVALALPAVGGALMAWLLSAPQFLFFALLSPVVALGSWISDRVSGHRLRRRTAADYAAELARSDQALAAAVSTAVGALDEAFPDPAFLATAVRRLSSPLWSRSRTSSDLLVVRLGTGRGPTGVTRAGADGMRTPVAADHLPVTADLAALGSLGVVGPRARVTGVARALLLQLVTLTPPTELRVVVLTPDAHCDDWRWTRWLPAVTVVGVPDRGLPADLPDDPEHGPRTVVLLDGQVGADTAAALAGAGAPVCVALAPSASSLAVSTAACLTVSGETGARGRLRLAGTPEEREITLDGVPEPVAAATARSLAVVAPPAITGGIPDTAALVDLPGGSLRFDPVAGQLSGRWDRGRATLECTLGATAQGPLALDLCAQGPHLLVAGTTGAGKSELLQTLVTGLALQHPPDRVSFLLVDYKGGAAFAEAAGLPHTVGMLTDLDPQSTVRALRSLTAELTRRERLLAGQGARDVSELPPEVPLVRLVIVVDEFATLAEELPGFVPGLVGIAQRGRSLGVHLVLATQRPSGVVSPEIRANCSLRICLRTTDESDSRDVLGTPLAASIPAGRPGRAYVRSGSEPPLLVQVARVSVTADRGRTGVRVRRRSWPPEPVPSGPGAPRHQGPGDLAALVDALQQRARHAGLTPPGRPWLAPLPVQLSAADLDLGAMDGAAATELRIGLLDSPDTQSQEPLTLDLADGGGWLAVGGPRSGRTTTLRTVLGEAVHQLGPAALHVHVLDHGGGGLAAEAAALPHTGTTVARDDPHRTVRLLNRLQAEVDRRRAGTAARTPALLLLVDGYESLAAQLDDAEPGSGSSALLRLVREGAAVGLTCVVTAERAVPGSRLAAAMRTRLVLPLPDRADYAIAGIGPRDVPAVRPPGRALVGEDAVECQLAQPRPTTPAPAPSGASGASGASNGPAAIRVVTLPADPELPLPASPPSGPGGPPELPVGPGNDEGEPVSIDLVRTGGLLVVGPPGSGRSSALAAFGEHCRAAGAAVLHLAPGRPPLGADAGSHRLDRGDAAGLREWAAATTGRLAVVVADDVGTLPDPVADALGSLARPGGHLVVLAAASAPELASAFRGPTVALRRSRTALLLRPAPGDAELLGLRVPRTPVPTRPGAGWLVVGGGVTRVQVARRRTAGRVPTRGA
ncbi:DNA segregation ATPase FtsK/SpoIIIE, S-DNA-T family [Modestobacter sp. DSM 44400]|uniref:FtsK/SpoIIIE domain-containing protein n=1 Tax=Modestobacter sp. DSM 44400 TaxID=1550230 RepID=UPI0008959411|nr:FtsK/SpoIIIE domain-containing protein [Modestobacter sp. DSM 44400]SDX48558.1 DNA segregation ATPase FtsK/SpoIIIE, S-DNA-T family [Modestobacter sp. DSM 44400]